MAVNYIVANTAFIFFFTFSFYLAHTLVQAIARSLSFTEMCVLVNLF